MRQRVLVVVALALLVVVAAGVLPARVPRRAQALRGDDHSRGGQRGVREVLAVAGGEGSVRQARHQARRGGHPARRLRAQDAAGVQQRLEPLGPHHVRAQQHARLRAALRAAGAVDPEAQARLPARRHRRRLQEAHAPPQRQAREHALRRRRPHAVLEQGGLRAARQQEEVQGQVQVRPAATQDLEAVGRRRPSSSTAGAGTAPTTSCSAPAPPTSPRAVGTRITGGGRGSSPTAASTSTPT